MKKLTFILAGAFMVLSLAACSPTEVAKESKPQAAQSNPEGITPEQLQAEKETQIDPKLVQDPNAVSYETLFVYYPNEAGNGLEREEVEAEDVTAELAVNALIEAGALDEAVTMTSWEVSGGVKAGPGVDPSIVSDDERIGTLELSGLDFDEDEIVLYALGNTFCEAFELDQLVLMVDGAIYGDAVFIDKYQTINE